MITSSLLYWITRLDSLKSINFVASMIFGILLMIGISSVVGLFAGGNKKEKKIAKKIIKPTITVGILFSISILVSALIPTTKEMAVIYVVPQIAQSEIVTDIPKDFKLLKDMAMKKVKEYIGKKGEE